jgi:hypothetical protein
MNLPEKLGKSISYSRVDPAIAQTDKVWGDVLFLRWYPTVDVCIGRPRVDEVGEVASRRVDAREGEELVEELAGFSRERCAGAIVGVGETIPDYEDAGCW